MSRDDATDGTDNTAAPVEPKEKAGAAIVSACEERNLRRADALIKATRNDRARLQRLINRPPLPR